MMDAPKRIWINLRGSRWVTDDDAREDQGDVDYLLGSEHDRLIAEKRAEIAAARAKALEDAARMVDCACECREAVLTANTRVERWTACGRDPCGALDAAAIRALIDKPGE